MDNSLIKIAKTALGYGWSLIPVSDDKMPLLPWKEFQSRRASETEVMAWFEKYPTMQLGVVTGQISNLTIVDQEAGADFNSIKDRTFKVETGGKGIHWYFQYDSDFKNAVRLLPLTDVRSEGGYCVLVGSQTKKGKYTILDGSPVAKMSAQTKEMLLTGKKVNTFINVFDKVNSYTGPKQGDYDGFGLGQRNEQMTKYIGHILAKVHPSEWQTLAWDKIKEANLRNSPPLPERELMASFMSIATREKSSGTTRWYQEEKTVVSYVDKLPVKKEYRPRYTWGTRGLDTAFAIIKRGNFIVLGAKSGSGKTTFAFDMAQKNALLGHHVLFLSLEMDEKEVKDAVARRRAGITVEEELDYKIPEKKQKHFESKLSEINAIPKLYFRGVRRGGGLRWEQILEIIYGYEELDLIFIDNLDLIEGNRGENDLERQKRIVKAIMGFTSEKQIPIVLIHHYRKTLGKDSQKTSTLDDLSGSMKIVDGADRIISVARNRDTEAKYPLKYQSLVYLQKGREYSDAIKKVYFIHGTFVDTPPPLLEYDPLGELEPAEWLKANDEKMREKIIERDLVEEHEADNRQASFLEIANK